MRPALACTLVLAAVSTLGCHTMAPVNLTQLGALKPSRAWVTLGDKSVVEVSGPQVLGDTLVGYVNGEYQELPAASVHNVTVQKSATGKTVGLVVVSAVAFGGFAYMITSSGKSTADTSKVFCDENPDRCM